jgi:hypothetical protein
VPDVRETWAQLHPRVLAGAERPHQSWCLKGPFKLAEDQYVDA